MSPLARNKKKSIYIKKGIKVKLSRWQAVEDYKVVKC
jgi:hypothetical protein